MSNKFLCAKHWEEDCQECQTGKFQRHHTAVAPEKLNPHGDLCYCYKCNVAFLEKAVAFEYLPQLRHKTSAERKAEPIHSGVMLYFPDALAAVSRVSKKGNDKHNPGEPLHWARGKSTDQMDCATRHSLTPGVVDTDSGEIELAHQAWRTLAELQLAEEKRLIAAGIMPYSGIVT